VGDARLALQAMLDIAGPLDLSACTGQRAALAARIAKGREGTGQESAEVRLSSAAPIRPERIMHELDALLTAEDTVVADASYSTLWVTNYLTARRAGQRFITPRGLAGLGWGMPMAMGARAWRRTVARCSAWWATAASAMCGRRWRPAGAWASRSIPSSSTTASWATRSMPST
jgi:thiamine pyrophosphate-dependent acetolactate synthase large subunit-like protein